MLIYAMAFIFSKMTLKIYILMYLQYKRALLSTEGKEEKQLEKFIRCLETNYKYSCFVTLTLKLVRKYNLSSVCKQVSDKCGIKQQKNYAVVVMRIGLLLDYIQKEKNITRGEAVEQIFNFLEENYMNCIQNKYRNINQGEKGNFLQLMKKKFIKDLKIFNKAFAQTYLNEQKTQSIFINLYRIRENPSKKQSKEALRLAKIVYGISNLGSKFQIDNPADLQEDVSQSQENSGGGQQKNNKEVEDANSKNEVQKSNIGNFGAVKIQAQQQFNSSFTNFPFHYQNQNHFYPHVLFPIPFQNLGYFGVNKFEVPEGIKKQEDQEMVRIEHNERSSRVYYPNPGMPFYPHP